LEEGLPALKTCGLNILVQDLLEQVMYGHIMLLAAFFMESQPPTGTIMIVIINFEFGMGRELHPMRRMQNSIFG
jgi:hypothetical protein